MISGLCLLWRLHIVFSWRSQLELPFFPRFPSRFCKKALAGKNSLSAKSAFSAENSARYHGFFQDFSRGVLEDAVYIIFPIISSTESFKHFPQSFPQ